MEIKLPPEIRFPENHIYPTTNFEDFYQKFSVVGDICETEEYKNIYSHFYTFSDWEREIPIDETYEDQENFDEKMQAQELERCYSDFGYFCHRYVKLHHPDSDKGIIRFTLYNYQRNAFRQYEEFRFNLISKFRQGGLTTLTCLWGLWKCLFSPAKILFISRSDREAVQTAGETVHTAMKYIPTWMYVKSDYEETKHEVSFHDLGSSMGFYTPKAARGKTMKYLIVDEAAFIPNMNEEYAAIYPLINKHKGNLIAISTPNGVGDWYHNTYVEAKKEKNSFNVIEIDFWEHPNYANPEWAVETYENIGPERWKREVLRDFMGSGRTYIRDTDIRRIEDEISGTRPHRVQMPEWDSERNSESDMPEGALYVFREPQAGHEYVMGVDAANGGGDNFCAQIVNALSLEQCAEFYSNSIDTTKFTAIINDLGLYYNNAVICVERQSTGGAILDMLREIHFYENIYKEEKSRKEGVALGTNRAAMVDQFRNRLTVAALRLRSPRIAKELATFVWNARKQRPEARSGCHDDAIMAMALAVYARDKLYQGIEETSPDLQINSATREYIRSEIFGSSLPKFDLSELRSMPWIVQRSDQTEPTRPHDKILREFNF